MLAARLIKRAITAWWLSAVGAARSGINAKLDCHSSPDPTAPWLRRFINRVCRVIVKHYSGTIYDRKSTDLYQRLILAPKLFAHDKMGYLCDRYIAKVEIIKLMQYVKAESFIIICAESDSHYGIRVDLNIINVLL